MVATVRTWLVKNVTVVNESGITSTYTLTLNSNQEGINRIARGNLGADTANAITSGLVLNAGDVLRAFSLTGNVRVTVFGADLTA